MEYQRMKPNKKQPAKQHMEASSQRFIICTFWSAGLIFSCIIAHCLKSSLYAPVLNYYEILLEQLQNTEINSVTLFLLVCKKQHKYFLLLWFFSFTNVWKYYYRLFLSYAGFQNGLLLSFCLFMNGAFGIIGFLCFLLPHALFFIPAYFITIYRGQLIYGQLQTETGHTKKSQLIFHQIPSFLVAISFLLIACLMGSYLNPFLLRLFFKL